MSKESKYLELGTCRRPHGIKGGFSPAIYNTKDSALCGGLELRLLPLDGSSTLPKEGSLFKVQSITFGNKPILYLEGISNRNDCEQMLPFSIQVERQLLPVMEDDNFYVVDMLGLEVMVDNKSWGAIKSFYENGAQIVFTLLGHEGEEIDLPFTENFFTKVDLEQQKVYVILPEYIE